MDLRQLQSEVGQWSRKNFGNQPAINPLIGVIEEIGETAHAFLKIRQGIRGDETKLFAELADSIGDSMIYLADFCSRRGVDLDCCFNLYADKSGRQEVADKALLNVAIVAGSLAEEFLHDNDEDGLKIDVGSLVGSLRLFAVLSGLTFDECVSMAWEEVKARDWKKNTINGTKIETVVVDEIEPVAPVESFEVDDEATRLNETAIGVAKIASFKCAVCSDSGVRIGSAVDHEGDAVVVVKLCQCKALASG